MRLEHPTSELLLAYDMIFLEGLVLRLFFNRPTCPTIGQVNNFGSSSVSDIRFEFGFRHSIPFDIPGSLFYFMGLWLEDPGAMARRDLT